MADKQSKKKLDPEVAAMNSLVRVFEGLSADRRGRVLDYANRRYGGFLTAPHCAHPGYGSNQGGAYEGAAYALPRLEAGSPPAGHEAGEGM